MTTNPILLGSLDDASGVNMVSAQIELINVPWNYNLFHNKQPLVKPLKIKNLSDQPLEHLMVSLTATPQVILPCTLSVDRISGNSQMELACSPVLNANVIYTLTDKIDAGITLKVMQGETILFEHTTAVSTLCFDEWSATARKEFLASFVLPNHPVIEEINSKAQKKLEITSGSGSMSAYQTRDPKVVKAVAKAIYDAIAELGLSYCTAPASFENTGQRVRLPDRILHDKKANCMDSTLLYAGCLEAAGLNAVLILVPGHIFCGVFTEDRTLSSCTGTTQSELQQLVSANLLVPVECTFMCKGEKSVPFSSATSTAAQELNEHYSYAVDLSMARAIGVTPLPVAIGYSSSGTSSSPDTDDEDSPDQEDFDEDDDFFMPEDDPQVAALPPAERKLLSWKQSVLPTTRANPTLSAKFKNLISFPNADLSRLCSTISGGKPFQLVPFPSELGSPPDKFEADVKIPMAEMEFHRGHLLTGLSKADLKAKTKAITKQDARNYDQFGFYTTMLGYGILRWCETKIKTNGKAEKVTSYAPVLLQPVTMKSVTGNTTVTASGPITLNPALKLRLTKEGISLSLQESPDPAETLNTLRKAIIGKSDWLILNRAVLGSFSGGAYTMYRDIDENSDYLKAHPITGSFLDGQIHFDIDQSANVTKKSQGEVLDPIGLNKPQRRVIEAAKNGASLILVGPPGTGKTQALVGLADIAAAGKPVLIVASKMASADVLSSRLTSLGLDPYCLRLTPGCDDKAKAHYLDTLDKKQKNRSHTSNYATQFKRFSRVQDTVDSYFDALNKPRRCGKTLRQLLAQMETLRHVHGFTKDYLPDTGSLSQERIQAQMDLLNKMAAMAKVLNPSTHPLRGFTITGDAREVETAYRKTYQALLTLSTEGAQIAAAFNHQSPVTLTDYDNLEKLLSTGELVSDPATLELLHDIEEGLAAKQNTREIRKNLRKVFSPQVFSLNGSALLQRYVTARSPKMAVLKELTKALQSYSRMRLTSKDTLTYLQQIEACQIADRQFQSLQIRCNAAFHTSPENVRNMYQDVLRLPDENLEALRSLISGGTAERFSKALSELDVSDRSVTLDSLTEDTYTLLSHVEQLPEWLAWCDLIKQAQELDMAGPAGAFTDGIDGTTIQQAWEKSVCKILTETLMASPVLENFTSASFQNDSELLENARIDLREAARMELLRRLDALVPNLVDEGTRSTAPGRFTTLLNSKEPLRQLFTDPEVRALALRTCPLVIATPEIVSEVFPMEKCFFLTTIEEASQVSVGHAVGVIARAESTMIVGDPKQLPVTSFFQSRIRSSCMAESILEEAANLNFPKVDLCEHYRSRHEDLIAFSNAKFYGGNLITLPAAGDVQSHLRLIEIAGQFDHGKKRTNQAEAEAVVRELLRLYQNREQCNFSVGVITFNIQQENLIELLFENECEQNEGLRHWAFDRECPLFIKNLENVQGDERDIILLSVGYSAKSNGSMTLNFGPLNQTGGQRRLNVAITRAKEEMLVFCSFKPELIPDSISNEGLLALREFLIYARDHTSGGTSEAAASGEDAICDSICQVLREAGWEAVPSVGSSSFRIDVALKAPNEDRYLLGVLLDKDASRDRLLKELGWELYHIYSPEWLYSRSVTASRILKHLEELSTNQSYPDNAF